MCNHEKEFDNLRASFEKLYERVDSMDDRLARIELLILGVRGANVEGVLDRQREIRREVNDLSDKLDRLIEERRLVFVAIAAFTITNLPDLADFVIRLLGFL